MNGTTPKTCTVIVSDFSAMYLLFNPKLLESLTSIQPVAEDASL
jgi:hypothetical protein